jgi:hypothetical protein
MNAGEIDCSNMPEGATHKNQRTGRWYMYESGAGEYSKGWYRSSASGSLWVKMKMGKAAKANLIELPITKSRPIEYEFGMAPLKASGGSYVPFPEKPKALDVQIGGGHYKSYAIQPVEFIHKNKIPYIEGCAIKYLCRWREKGGIEDLKKVKHYIDLLIEMEQQP